ncbi:MAG: long-chain fatty acid--CoA ligase [Chloroflexi bacterium GWB2_49_20]|nr:MAG: long-chain fatty acid--CoA ligase [Chloroflexi bacterium GWB2_49_20]OGN79940.1 MAG: long-chain fatty acid--CoA ligase [Chloroflexi bacterium GWC2_49_37]OGN85525.1 MAG: long-chain fatty acid--CoA ligase [Chloroflexi bacterium GWD2_49_16]HBG74399.1 long-chain fatty acid--CoA ligase [Anaerolineae bacterium]HCM96991.1 long-chain fatty acid--CoA ligase [Anaerolineae bacterium]
MYIGDYLSRRELYSPEKMAFIDAGKSPEWRLTFRDANKRSNQLANWLQIRGVTFGDRVAILARDGYEHLDVFFACSKLGAIHTALNWRLHWQELIEIFQNVKPSILVFSDDFKENVTQLMAHYPLTSLHLDGNGIPGSFPFETTLQAAPGTPVTCEKLEAEHTAALIFTGGTTGLPKAAEVSHRMIAWNTLNTVIHDITHNDIYLNVFPMFHTGGLFVYTLPQVIFGGTTIFINKFDPVQVLDLIEREKVTVFAGVPTMYQMLTQAPNWERADLTSLRFCTSGGAPLPVPLVEKYTSEKGIRFKQGFGMTEFGPGIFALAPEDAIRKAGSIGRPNFFVDARVVDDENNFLGPDEAGELVLKGPSYCSGYFNNPDASTTVVDQQGYFHTSDVARYDAEGYFYIVDRKKDMFISGGENVFPAEIEKVLYQHPSVHMCAVIGLPDPGWGEVGKACVVLKPDASAAEEELLKFMTERLAKFKVPKSVTFMDALPISAAGKILKRELRDQFTKE